MKRYVIILAGCFAIIGLSSCTTERVVVEKQPVVYTETHTEYVYENPPVERMETMTVAPGSDYAWVRGHWTWMNDRWTWSEGYWQQKPAASSVWIAGHWERTPNGWVWYDGHWS